MFLHVPQDKNQTKKNSPEMVDNQQLNLGGLPGLLFHYSDTRLIRNPVQPGQCNRKLDGQWSRQKVLLCILRSTASCRALRRQNVFFIHDFRGQVKES